MFRVFIFESLVMEGDDLLMTVACGIYLLGSLKLIKLLRGSWKSFLQAVLITVKQQGVGGSLDSPCSDEQFLCFNPQSIPELHPEEAWPSINIKAGKDSDKKRAELSPYLL